MADIYVDGELATGTNDGSTWANARQGEAGLQAGFDVAVAGDVLHLTRTFILTSIIDIDQTSGTSALPVRVIGYNYNSGSPVVDGTFAVIDGNVAVNNCILGDNIDFWTMENIEFKNALEDNISAQNNPMNNWSFINCHSHHAGLGLVSGSGWGHDGADQWQDTAFVLCKAYLNLDNGIYSYSCSLFGCTSYSNGADGFVGGYGQYNNCLSYSNTDAGFAVAETANMIINCVADGNGAGVHIGSGEGPIMLMGSRITNNTIGIEGDVVAPLFLDCYNFYNNNGTNFDNVIPLNQIRGQSTRTTIGIEGYIDRVAGNFGLLDTAAARRMEVQL